MVGSPTFPSRITGRPAIRPSLDVVVSFSAPVVFLGPGAPFGQIGIALLAAGRGTDAITALNRKSGRMFVRMTEAFALQLNHDSAKAPRSPRRLAVFIAPLGLPGTSGDRSLSNSTAGSCLSVEYLSHSAADPSGARPCSRSNRSSAGNSYRRDCELRAPFPWPTRRSGQKPKDYLSPSISTNRGRIPGTLCAYECSAR